MSQSQTTRPQSTEEAARAVKAAVMSEPLGAGAFVRTLTTSPVTRVPVPKLNLMFVWGTV